MFVQIIRDKENISINSDKIIDYVLKTKGFNSLAKTAEEGIPNVIEFKESHNSRKGYRFFNVPVLIITTTEIIGSSKYYEANMVFGFDNTKAQGVSTTGNKKYIFYGIEALKIYSKLAGSLYGYTPESIYNIHARRHLKEDSNLYPKEEKEK